MSAPPGHASDVDSLLAHSGKSMAANERVLAAAQQFEEDEYECVVSGPLHHHPPLTPSDMSPYHRTSRWQRIWLPAPLLGLRYAGGEMSRKSVELTCNRNTPSCIPSTSSKYVQHSQPVLIRLTPPPDSHASRQSHPRSNLQWHRQCDSNNIKSGGICLVVARFVECGGRSRYAANTPHPLRVALTSHPQAPHTPSTLRPTKW